MYDVGSCPICSNGLRGVRICCERPIIVCDECDAVWSSPDPADRRSTVADPPCEVCGKSLWGDQARWATQPEIEAAGWWPQVRNETAGHCDAGNSDSDDSASNAAPAATSGSGLLAVTLVLVLAGVAVAALAVL